MIYTDGLDPNLPFSDVVQDPYSTDPILHHADHKAPNQLRELNHKRSGFYLP